MYLQECLGHVRGVCVPVAGVLRAVRSSRADNAS